MDEDSSPPSPVELIDISSGSEESLAVDNSDIFERFRIGGPPSTNLMTAFMGAATASLYPETGSSQEDESMQVDTRGSTIETELYSLMGDLPDLSPISFFESSGEDNGLVTTANFANVGMDNHDPPPYPVRSTTTMDNGVVEPTVTYTNEWQNQMNGPNVLDNTYGLNPIQTFPNQAYRSLITNQVPTYPMNWSTQIGFTQTTIVDNVTRTHEYMSTNYDPQHPGQMFPPVMPNVAGYCHWCGKTFDQVALETLIHYIQCTEYPDETIRDRNVRCRAFTDGFEAALICFKNAGLSQPRTCVRPEEQQGADRGF